MAKRKRTFPLVNTIYIAILDLNEIIYLFALLVVQLKVCRYRYQQEKYRTNTTRPRIKLSNPLWLKVCTVQYSTSISMLYRRGNKKFNNIDLITSSISTPKTQPPQLQPNLQLLSIRYTSEPWLGHWPWFG